MIFATGVLMKCMWCAKEFLVSRPMYRSGAQVSKQLKQWADVMIEIADDGVPIRVLPPALMTTLEPSSIKPPDKCEAEL